MEEKPFPQSLLPLLHNMGITDPKRALKAEELLSSAPWKREDIDRELERYEGEGYVKSVQGRDGPKRYYLTDRGIIKVCASFS